jgi:branched-chain amino acid aminotransferase
MVDTLKIEVQRVSHSRITQVDFDTLPFGKVYTDHMFIADYKQGQWTNLRIIPYGHISVSPATPAIHYGQSIFEGMKAYASKSGEALVFRALDNLRRLNISAERMCMPPVPDELFIDGLSALLEIDKQWIPTSPGSSLYIRPFLFSADEYIGIRASENFTFMIILSPVGPYYAAPVKVLVENHFTRAVQGGTGYAKAGGNYGGAIYPTKLAQQKGFDQLIWTDGKTHEFIEESGTMNVMFVIDEVLVTPALSDSILAGITRDSVLKLVRSWGVKAEERKISVKELQLGLEEGRVKEAFGAGTAATIAHIDLIGIGDKNYKLPPVEKRVLANRILTELESIKRGTKSDPFNWVTKF